jgi:hypothetical protein
VSADGVGVGFGLAGATDGLRSGVGVGLPGGDDEGVADDADELGGGLDAGASLGIGTTETDPVFAADGSLTTMRRLLSTDPNTVEGFSSSETGWFVVALPSTQGVVAPLGQTRSTFFVLIE